MNKTINKERFRTGYRHQYRWKVLFVDTLKGMRLLFPAFLLIFSYNAMAQQSKRELILDGIKDKIDLEPFAYQDVRITGGSLNRQIEETKHYYLEIPNVDLLKGFRERMHLPTYGAQDLGGWYSKDQFHIFGQIVAGLSRLYAVTGDADCRNKVDALIDGWAKCIDSTGYFFYSTRPNAPHYEYEKILGGLLDAYEFAGNKKALDYLSLITDWAIKNLTRDHRFAGEWYTLPQNLYRAYRMTNDEKYLKFANEWEYSDFWGSLRQNNLKLFSLDSVPSLHPFHAYSHLNSLSSAAEAYLVKGDEDYEKTIKNGYNFFVNDESFATGGFGPNESLLSKPDLIKSLRTTHKSFETQCGTWAAFKLSKYLLMITGNGQYGDWIEKLIINGAGADIPMSSDGRVLYYSDYNPREGMKDLYMSGWSCCAGTRVQNVAEYSHLIYFKDKNGIYVNLFTPSEVKWNKVTLIQNTRFPKSDEALFTIKTETSRSFIFHFRKPSWIQSQPRVLVNGKEVKIDLSNNWYQIERQWKDGDQIKVILPMSFEIDRLDKSQKYPAAITYGPVVMAIRSGNFPYPSHLLESSDFVNSFIPVQGAPLNFRVKNNPDLLLRPYFEFKAHQPYIMYIDPKVKNEIRESEIITTGDWHGKSQYTYEIGATVSTSFKGNSIKFKGERYANAGMLKVEIDGKIVDTLDQYGGERTAPWYRGVPFEHTFKNLGEGKHTIVMTVIKDRNEESKGNWASYVGFEESK